MFLKCLCFVKKSRRTSTIVLRRLVQPAIDDYKAHSFWFRLLWNTYLQIDELSNSFEVWNSVDNYRSKDNRNQIGLFYSPFHKLDSFLLRKNGEVALRRRLFWCCAKFLLLLTQKGKQYKTSASKFSNVPVSVDTSLLIIFTGLK